MTLRQSAFGPALLYGLGSSEQGQLHARAARLLRRDPELRVRAAAHYLRAGQPEDALELLVTAARSDALAHEWFPNYDELIGAALRACAELARPPRDAFLLRRARVHHHLSFAEPAESTELLSFAAELETLSGLARYRELDPGLDPAERLRAALEFAQANYERMPAELRMYSPIEAISELASYISALAGYAVGSFDYALLRAIPSLAPLVVLSPGIAVAEGMRYGFLELRAGRHEHFVQSLVACLELLDHPDHAGLSGMQYQRTRLGIIYALAATDAALGRSSAFERARELEALPQLRSNA